MTLGTGAVLITFSSFLVTNLIFCGAYAETKKGKFFFWLKSTLFLAVMLTIWIHHKEPEMDLIVIASMNLVLSGIMTAARGPAIGYFP